jgi:hypothetical protein
MPDEAGARAPRVLDELRGGTWGGQSHQDAAAKVTAAWPRAREAVRWYDRFRSAVAEDAVRRGMRTVVFGAPGFPYGESPHHAAARVSPKARFTYAGPDPVVAGQRGLEGFGRAVAVAAFVRRPHDLLEAAGLLSADGRWLADGPCQIQWGLVAMLLDDDEAGQVAACYGKLLPPGSELVIAAPDGPGGAVLAEACGGRPHTGAEIRRWCAGAGLVIDPGRPITDVRAWGREDMGRRLTGDRGRIVVAVATVP